jgi:hypothetical protein
MVIVSMLLIRLLLALQEGLDLFVQLAIIISIKFWSFKDAKSCELFCKEV